ncbi:amino acid permease/ SLC12A domain-containing protein [Ilyonectria sp. MPI-CAGE-AT-0026]|nr:amino acid permease/ SLC12A domain-containing protein [Ilyonectria sp. MPI-CAGE-AT-0026]
MSVQPDNGHEKKDSDPLDSHEIEPSTYAEGHAEVNTLQRTVTKRDIKSRHAQMIAIGGTIGTGLFVGIGQALATAGPVSVLLAYSIICVFVYGIVTATSEVSAYLPIAGSSMAYYGSRYVSKSLGFAMGCLYFYSFGILVAYEITAAALVIEYWPNAVPTAVWITIIFVVIVALNLSPVGVYAETEFWFASVKVIMLVGLLILSVVLCLGGGPSHDRLGFRYWKHGAMNEYLVHGDAGRFCGFLYALTFSVFSFNFGPELIVLTGGEMRAPRKNLPRAAKTFIWRLIAFYILGSFAIGIICRSNAPGLTNGGHGAAASPWVIAIKVAGIGSLDSVINAGIIISAWSSGNSYLYMSSRSLYSLSKSGSAPKIFQSCTKWGLPIYAVVASSLFGLLAYLNVSSSTSEVFNWFINLTNTAGFTSWICCSIILLRFRMACKAQGVTDLPFQSKLQPYAAYLCLVFFTILMLLNGFSVFFPGQWSASVFLTAYIGIPIFLSLYFGHRLWHKQDPWLKAPSDIDLHSNLEEILICEGIGETEVGDKKSYVIRRVWKRIHS